MAVFPLLKTGAVTQYPLTVTTTQPCELIRFLDGSDQRYLMQARQLRRWQIQLHLLSEVEMQSLEAFFDAQLGAYSTFSFPDPYTGVPVPNCRMGEDGFLSEYLGNDVSATSFWVVETYG